MKLLTVIMVLVGVSICAFVGVEIFSASEKLSISHSDSVAVYKLALPEVWYQVKATAGSVATYTHASGALLIRKGTNSDSLLFKLSDSANIFSWQESDETLQAASKSDWDAAADEVSMYRHALNMKAYSATKALKIATEAGLRVSGKQVLSARVGQHFTDMISLTGPVQQGSGGLLTSQNDEYKGTAYFEIFARDTTRLVSIATEMTDFQTVPYHESFWRDSRMLVVPLTNTRELLIVQL